MNVPYGRMAPIQITGKVTGIFEGEGKRRLEILTDAGDSVIFIAGKRENPKVGDRVSYSAAGCLVPEIGADGKMGKKGSVWKLAAAGSLNLPGASGYAVIEKVLSDGGEDPSYAVVSFRKNNFRAVVARRLKNPKEGDVVSVSGYLLDFGGEGTLPFMPYIDRPEKPAPKKSSYFQETLLGVVSEKLDYADIDFSRLNHPEKVKVAEEAVRRNGWLVVALDMDEFTDAEYAKICMAAREEREGLLLMDTVKFAKGAGIDAYLAICSEMLKRKDLGSWAKDNIQWGLFSRRQKGLLSAGAKGQARKTPDEAPRR